MPRKQVKKSNKTNARTSQRTPRSYVSLLYGVLTVVIIFIVVLFALKFMEIGKQNAGQITETAAKTEKSQELSLYTVKKGDTLWTIAETQYNNGNKWVEIARTNNISNPGEVEVGQKLVLSSVELHISSSPTPKITSEITQAPTATPATIAKATIAPTKTPVMTSTEAKITTKTYTVKRGDTLWDIAERAYGNPYRWTEIAKANKLANPDLIHAGNVFQLPR